MTAANVVTCGRILLTPVFAWLWATGHLQAALTAFCLAAASDLLDGLLARALDQRTRLGAILDPAADKLLLLVSFLVAAHVGALPWWLAAVVIGRDLVVAAGVAILALAIPDRFDAGGVHPTRLGKYSTMFEALTIGLALVGGGRANGPLAAWVAALVIIAFALALVSGLQYVGRGVLIVAGVAPAPAPPTRAEPA